MGQGKSRESKASGMGAGGTTADEVVLDCRSGATLAGQAGASPGVGSLVASDGLAVIASDGRVLARCDNQDPSIPRIMDCVQQGFRFSATVRLEPDGLSSISVVRST